MNTDELIRRLVADTVPVRPLPSLRNRLFRWAIVTLGVASGGVLAIGLRTDLEEAVGRPGFVAMTALLAATTAFAAAAALAASVPGTTRPVIHRALPIAAAASWPVVLMFALVHEARAGGVLAFEFHGACGPLIAGLACLPGLLLFRMARAGVTLQPEWGATLATLAAAASAAATLQIVCPFDAPAHHLLEHLLPAATLCAVGGVVGRRWLAATRALPVVE